MMSILFKKNLEEKTIPQLLSNTRSLGTHVPMSSNRHFGKLLSLAVGAGVLVSATGIMLYHYLYGRRYIFVLERDLNKLNLTLAELRQEFEDLKNRKHNDGRKRSEDRSRYSISGKSGGQHKWKSNSSAAGSMASLSAANFTDGAGSMYSAVESDDDVEDEFCDITDSSDSESTKDRTESLTPLIRSPQAYCTSATANSLKSTYTTTPEIIISSDNMADLKEIDKLLDGNDSDKTKAYSLLLEINKKTPDDWKVLWRLARAAHSMGTIEGAKGDQKGKQKYIVEGLEYGKKALELNQNESKVHKWYAICVGALGQFLSTKEKIQGGVTYKEHVEKAIELEPKDATLYNLLGRFELEVASLSSMERRVASWLFAEVPKGSIEDAIAKFRKAEELNKKPWKENRLLLAKCYIQQGTYPEAVEWLDKALEIPPATSEEGVFDEEINKLLRKYGSYRVSKS